MMKAFLLPCSIFLLVAFQLPAQEAPNLDLSTKKVTTVKKWTDAQGQERTIVITKEAPNTPENTQWLESEDVAAPSNVEIGKEIEIRSANEQEMEWDNEAPSDIHWEMEELREDLNQKWPEIGEKLRDAEVHIYRMHDDIQNQFTKRAFLGVVTEPTERGARILEIVEGSAAQTAGLQVGDILVTLENHPLKGHEELIEALAQCKPGDVVHIKYLRGEKEETISATLGENKNVIRQIEKVFKEMPGQFHGQRWNMSCDPETSKKAFLGIMMEEKDGQVLINEVIPNSPAQAVGLLSGDVLYQINDKSVNTPEEVATQIGELESGKSVSLRIRRDGKKETIKVVLGTREGCCAPCCCMPKGIGESKKRQDDPEIPAGSEHFFGSNPASTLEIPSLKIFPNPTSDQVRVSFQTDNTDLIKIRILDSQGKTVINQSIIGADSYDEAFDLQQFPAGNYTIMIEQGGKFLTKSIIRNN